MKPFILLASVAAITLAACGPELKEDQGAERTLNTRATADASPKTVEIGGVQIRVLDVRERGFALAGATSSGGYTGSSLEQAAAQVTGCQGEIEPGDWVFLGDLGNFQLSNLQPPNTQPFPSWKIALSC